MLRGFPFPLCRSYTASAAGNPVAASLRRPGLGISQIVGAPVAAPAGGSVHASSTSPGASRLVQNWSPLCPVHCRFPGDSRSIYVRRRAVSSQTVRIEDGRA